MCRRRAAAGETPVQDKGEVRARGEDGGDDDPRAPRPPPQGGQRFAGQRGCWVKPGDRVSRPTGWVKRRLRPCGVAPMKVEGQPAHKEVRLDRIAGEKVASFMSTVKTGAKYANMRNRGQKNQVQRNKGVGGGGGCPGKGRGPDGGFWRCWLVWSPWWDGAGKGSASGRRPGRLRKGSRYREGGCCPRRLVWSP